MSAETEFAKAALIPAPGDNAAMALGDLAAGTLLRRAEGELLLASPVLEGHRIALHPIRRGEPLLSWGLPFGRALRDIAPGEWLRNEKTLVELRSRPLAFTPPSDPNFEDQRHQARLEEFACVVDDVPFPAREPLNFQGFLRPAGRGRGTRNHVVILGTSSLAGPFCSRLARELEGVARLHPTVDGVAAIAHTEGAGEGTPNNRGRTLRTLAGFLANPNVGAALVVETGAEWLGAATLLGEAAANGHPLDGVPIETLSLKAGFESALAAGRAAVQRLLAIAGRASRIPIPWAAIKLGLQCGGSDAFSGVTANPLLGILARETVWRGGFANLAETSELIGAEPYVLARVRSLDTARAFLATLDRFQEWAGWHGHSAEGNPSGGNLYRGLCNIVVKSIGAARKKDPLARLDHVLGYAEPMRDPGYCFMDSPGNDLESVAGQVASGANLILFSTGNGSITNFPFVPTIKVLTTTSRWRLVGREMDFNAGRLLDGEDLEDLGREAFELLGRVASGARTAGEKAGHSQAQLWRDWRRTGGEAATPRESLELPGKPIHLDTAGAARVPPPQAARGRVGLILPTSLCAGQIAGMIADSLNAQPAANTHYTALPHTEGCGNSRGDSERLFMRLMIGHLTHPLVGAAMLLEHGCEKTHNDAFRAALVEAGVDPGRLGWASIQMDGGIEPVTRKIQTWFAARSPSDSVVQRAPSVAIAWGADLPPSLGDSLATLARQAIRWGGSAILPEGLAPSPNFPWSSAPATLACGQRAVRPGAHVMAAPTRDPLEITTSLAATGVDLIVHASRAPLPGHPLVPTLHIGHGPSANANDFDLLWEGDDANALGKRLAELVAATLAGRHQTLRQRQRNLAFQIPRGDFGISL